jgi:hypothetical protein
MKANAATAGHQNGIGGDAGVGLYRHSGRRRKRCGSQGDARDSREGKCFHIRLLPFHHFAERHPALMVPQAKIGGHKAELRKIISFYAKALI